MLLIVSLSKYPFTSFCIEQNLLILTLSPLELQAVTDDKLQSLTDAVLLPEDFSPTFLVLIYLYGILETR